jgi:hypothetical protein
MPLLFDQISGYPIVFWKFGVGQTSRSSNDQAGKSRFNSSGSRPAKRCQRCCQMGSASLSTVSV